MREGCLLKRKTYAPQKADVAFAPALLPLEACALTAREKPNYGALSLVKTAYEASGGCLQRSAQRAKIWVR